MSDFFRFCVFTFRGKTLHKFEVGIINCRQKPENFRVLVGYGFEVNRIVCDNLVLDFALFGVVDKDENFVDAAILHLYCLLFGNHVARVRHDFARFGVEHVLGKRTAGKPVRKIEFFIEFISADLYDVVTARVEKQIVEVLFNGSFRGNFAGTQSSVKLYKSVGFRLCAVLGDCVVYDLIVSEQIQKRTV